MNAEMYIVCAQGVVWGETWVRRAVRAVVNAKVWKQTLEKVPRSGKKYMKTQNGLHFISIEATRNT